MLTEITLILMLTLTITFAPTPEVTTELQRLTEDIAALPYETSQIKHNVFDCSDTSAITQNELSKKGWTAHILVLSRADGMNHAMVRVYANETYYIECTRKRIVADIPAGYTGVDEYEDVVAAVQQSGYKPLEWGVATCTVELERKRVRGTNKIMRVKKWTK